VESGEWTTTPAGWTVNGEFQSFAVKTLAVFFDERCPFGAGVGLTRWTSPWVVGGLQVGALACAAGTVSPWAAKIKAAAIRSRTDIPLLGFAKGSEQIAERWVRDREFMKTIEKWSAFFIRIRHNSKLNIRSSN
jgi:hypothetical protein